MAITEKAIETLRDELDVLRGHLDHLRVQANLGGKELRDRLRELEDQLEPVGRRVVDGLTDLTRAGTREALTWKGMVEEAWEAVRRTHREAAEKVRQKCDE